jgi:phage-related minor tail protein
VNVLIDGVNFVNPFDDIPHIPRIPLLAAGGVVNRPTLAIVGEAGPEVVLPLSAGRAGRRQQLMGEAGIGGGGVQVTYSPRLTVPSAPTAAEAAAILEQDLERSLSLGLLNARLGEVTAA